MGATGYSKMTRHSQAQDLVEEQAESSTVVPGPQNFPSIPERAKPYHYPGIETVVHGNGAVAHVMGHVCGGVRGYPITPAP